MQANANDETSDWPKLSWTEGGETLTARWQSEAPVPPPARVLVADDTMTADTACRLARDGTAMLWRGDFQNARQLLQAMARRLDRKKTPVVQGAMALPAREMFHRHRMALAQRAGVLGKLLIPLSDNYMVPLRRAPEVAKACVEAYGEYSGPLLLSLRELLGLIGAREWRKKGVNIEALGARIHPHYGVFSPVRGEYVNLVATVPLSAEAKRRAFDIGTGTGVLAAVLAKRGVSEIIATDQDPRALACARENLERLGLLGQVSVVQHDMFPPGRASLIVCNPPWVPATPSSPVERAIFDPDSRMLAAFLTGLVEHLDPGGEGWLILSDLAEHLGLRTRQSFLDMISAAGLRVADRHDIRPVHPKVGDATDPLHAARAAEITSLWRLVRTKG